MIHLSSAQSVVYALWEEVPKLVYYRLICKPVIFTLKTELEAYYKCRWQAGHSTLKETFLWKATFSVCISLNHVTVWSRVRKEHGQDCENKFYFLLIRQVTGGTTFLVHMVAEQAINQAIFFNPWINYLICKIFSPSSFFICRYNFYIPCRSRPSRLCLGMAYHQIMPFVH